MLRACLINTVDHGGGAETFARLLAASLRKRGHEATLWIGRDAKRPDELWTRVIPSTGAERAIAARYGRRGFFGMGVPSSRKFCHSAALQHADVIHLHNLHGHYFSIADVPLLARRAPLVWTVHDFFPITGGCAFPNTCERWQHRCGQCPELGKYPIATQFDRTRRMQSIKRMVFRDLRATLISPSRHLAGAICRSGMFPNCQVHTVPYGIDAEVFHPHRSAARQRLDLPRDATVVLLGAQGLDDPRKGTRHAIDALRSLKLDGLKILLAGGGDTSRMRNALGPERSTSYGYVTDRRLMSDLFAASNLCLFTSLAENYPCSVMEAMACGTPVLAFDIPGVDEQVVDGQTGFLVPAGDGTAYAHTLRELMLNSPLLARVGAEARRAAETRWSIDRITDAYLAIYRAVLQTSTAGVDV